MAARVPAMRIASRVQIASSFFPRSPASSSSRRGGHAAGAPPALTADVRVIVRRHFPVVVGGPSGCGTRTVRVVAEDIALRRRASRQLRTPELVERALAKDVLPLVGSPLDRAAVASKEICAHVSAACASSRVALSGVRVLVLIDTFQRPVPVVFRALPPPCKPTWSSGAVNNKSVTARTYDPCIDLESELPATATKWPRQPVGDRRVKQVQEPRQPVGVVGDRRVKQVQEPCVDCRFEGWLPW